MWLLLNVIVCSIVVFGYYDSMLLLLKWLFGGFGLLCSNVLLSLCGMVFVMCSLMMFILLVIGVSVLWFRLNMVIVLVFC